LLATLLFVDVDSKLAAILGCTAALAVVGVVDDRVAVPPAWRITAELVATSVLFNAGIRWSPLGVPALDFALTALWIVGIVNAFNLMDNLDGAASTVTAVSCAGIGSLALINGHATYAVAAFAVTGALAGFLPYNLAGPGRIFLGDGGSMPLGFLVATLAIVVTGGHGDAVLVGAMLAGLPILDTTLVSVSRLRRGVTIVTAGRDHLTHRLLQYVGSPGRVCRVLLMAQGALVALAVVVSRAGHVATVTASAVSVALGVVAIATLDSRSRPATSDASTPETKVETHSRGHRNGSPAAAANPELAEAIAGGNEH
jgi:UDP-GlcNAc:undecaprenyl-phosphate GlcNAc-1-phosphate transferase